MHFEYTKTTPQDLSTYTACLDNPEFSEMLYRGEHVNLKKYLSDSPGDYKFVGHLVTPAERKPIGFAHFYGRENNVFNYLGGIVPEYFNSGVGLYASVGVLSTFFSIVPNASIITGIYKFNDRSLKVDLALGFVLERETDEKWILSLNPINFQNAFTDKIRQRITFSYLG